MQQEERANIAIAIWIFRGVMIYTTCVVKHVEILAIIDILKPSIGPVPCNLMFVEEEAWQRGKESIGLRHANH